MLYTGELAALGTAILWSFTSLFFTSAGKRIGSYHLNKIRIPFAVFHLAILLLIMRGSLFPVSASADSYWILIISGVIGLTLGDLALFSAFIVLGTRKTLLIFASSPIMAAVIAWFILGEGLSLFAISGIAITILGISWVISERQTIGAVGLDRKKLWLGILLALGGAAGQAIGLVLAKAGMSDGFDPLNATFLRMLAAAVAIWLIGLVRRDNMETLGKLRDRRATLLSMCGSITGPFLGVWLSLIAVKYTSAGIAAAIMATVPVLVIPLVVIFYKEKVSVRALFGAIIAAGGVAILFLS